MKNVLLLIFAVFSAIFINAQKYSVEGRVIDFHDKTPLNNAKIQIGNQKTTSDSKGHFFIKNIAPGNYTLVAKHEDCNDFTETLSVQSNLNINITLEHHTNEIETVVLHGNQKKSGSMVISTLDKNVIARNASDNLGNLLSNVSGLGSLKTGNNISKPIIHGLYGSRVAILNNGVKLAEQEWGVEHAPNVEVSNFEHIDVVKGASALKFGGDAVGGVVLLEPAIFPKKDTLMGNISLSGISNGRGGDFNVNLAKTWKNGWAVHTNGSFKKLGDLQAPNYGLMNTGLQNSSFSFGVQKQEFKRGFSFDYYLTNQTIGILRSSHIGSPEDLAQALSSQTPIFTRDFSYEIGNPTQDVEHHLAKLSAYQRFENFGKLSFTYSFQYNHRKEYDIRRTEELSQIPSLDMELITNDININHLLERGKFSLETGINAQYQNNYSNPATESRRLIPNYDKYSAGLYSIFKYKISPSFNAELGARYDFTRYDVKKWFNLSDWEAQYADEFSNFEVRTNLNRILVNPILNYNNFSFNGGIEYHPSGKFNLRFNYARVSRTPNIAELFADGSHHSAAILEKGDMRIQNETGNQFNLVATAKLDVLSGLNISVNPYFFYTKNFINQVPSGYQNTQWGNFVIWKYQQINSKMYGLDVDLDLKITENLKYRGNASYVYGQDTTNDVPLIMMLPPNFSNTLEFSQPKWSNFFFSVNNTSVLQQKRFPVYNIDVQLFDNDGEAYYQPVDISTPPKGYSLWNLQTGVSVAKNMNVQFAVKNVFNTAYRDYLNRLRYFSDEMGRSFILTLKYQF